MRFVSEVARLRIAYHYCTVSVNVAVGVPQNAGPTAVTATAPAVEGSVNSTVASPLAAVRTILWFSAPALSENRRSTLPAVAPFEAG